MTLSRSLLAGIAGLILASPLAGAAPVDTLEAAEAAFRDVDADLAAHGPSIENTEARSRIAAALDDLVNVQVTRRMSAGEVQALAPVRDFHLRRIDGALEAIERTEVKEGVMVFKLYSSSVILKSPDGVIAIDFQEGPLPDNRAEPEQTSVGRQTGFHWTPEQRDRFARMVDISLVTHKDYDHASYSLTRRLLEQGKPVIVPEQLRLWWSDLKDRLTVPAYETPVRFGPVEIFVMRGRQLNRENRETKEAASSGEPQEPHDPDSGRETNVYLAKVNGIIFLQAAENGVPIREGMEKAIATGFRPDVYFSLGAPAGRASITTVMRKVGPTFLMPIHEYEMTHGGGGNRTAGWFTPGRKNLIRKGLAMPLFWGEHFHLTPAMFPWKADSAAYR